MSASAEVTRSPDCDVCAQQNKSASAAYDGKTVFGPWAHMCQPCFDDVGVGLGTGKGQRLVLASAPANPGVRFPDAVVVVSGLDGNAFAVLGAVNRALREAGALQAEINEFFNDAQSGDYDHLLKTAMKWVTFE